MADAVGLAAELDVPPVVGDVVDHGGGHLVVSEHRPPPAGLATMMRTVPRGGARDERAVCEGPHAPEALHRRFQETDSQPLQRWQAQPRDQEEDEGRRDLPRRQLSPHAGDGEVKYIVEHEWSKRRYLDVSKLEEMDELKGKAEV